MFKFPKQWRDFFKPSIAVPEPANVKHEELPLSQAAEPLSFFNQAEALPPTPLTILQKPALRPRPKKVSPQEPPTIPAL